MVLKVSDYSSEGLFKNVNFTLKKGEILGISGLMGAGRTELVETIFGFRKGGHGKIEKDGKEISIHSPQQAIAYGIALMPEDRKTVGLNLIASVKDNLSVISLNSYCKGGLVMRRREEADCRGIVEKLHIKTPGMSQKVGNLSGGNQQKIVIGKWLLSNCDIFIMDEPTRGIDVSAKTEIYNIIKNLASQGKSIIMISSEMSEIIGLCDRTLVIMTGGIDLSVGSVLALAGIITASFSLKESDQHMALGFALLAGAVVSLFCGFCNGIMVTKGKIAPFIATMVTMTVVRGCALVYTNGRPVTGYTPEFAKIGQGYAFGVPIPVMVFLVLIIISVILLHFSRFGRHVYAVGGNIISAKASGLNTDAILIKVYMICALFTGIAGIVLSSRVNAASPTSGEGLAAVLSDRKDK